MTFNEVINKNGIILDCDISGTRWGTYEIIFENSESGEDDHVTFDVIGPGTRSGNEACKKLFDDFCKVENINKNTVYEVHIIQASESLRAWENRCGITMNILQNNLYIFLPEELSAEILQDYGGLYCILDINTWEMYSHIERKTRKPVFCSISENGKLYENDSSAIRSAKRILSDDPAKNLCITYYGLALRTYFRTGLVMRTANKFDIS